MLITQTNYTPFTSNDQEENYITTLLAEGKTLWVVPTNGELPSDGKQFTPLLILDGYELFELTHTEIQPLATATEAQPQKQGQGTEAEAPNNTSLLSQIDLAKNHMSTILYHKTRTIEYKVGCEDISGYIKQNGRKSRHSSRLKVPGKVVFYSRNAKGERVVIRQDAKDSTLYLTEYKESQILIRQDTKGETLYLTNQDKGDKKAYRFTYSLENTTAHVDALWQMFNALASI